VNAAREKKNPAKAVAIAVNEDGGARSALERSVGGLATRQTAGNSQLRFINLD